MSAAAVGIRKARPDDAAGVAAVLNGVISAGSPTLLDTTFSVDEERAYIESLPARSFLHVAEAPGAGIVGFQTVIPWNTFVTTEFDHVATIGTYVDAAHRRQGWGGARAEQLRRRARPRLRQALHRPARRQPRLARLPPGAGVLRGRRGSTPRARARKRTSTSCSSNAS